jgi:hypothetical protein
LLLSVLWWEQILYNIGLETSCNVKISTIH